MEINDTSVEVLYDFEYPVKGGKKITIKEGERLYLIKKTNTDWWQVIRSNERRPFYVPSTYVREIVPTRHGSTSSLGKNDDQRFTVSLNIKQKPALHAKPNKVTKSVISGSFSNVRVLLNNDQRDRNVNSSESLSASDNSDADKRSGGYSVVRLPKKSISEYGEANILEEEQLSESLTELARQIAFKPRRSGISRREYVRRLDGLKYSGSFKTKHERKQMNRQVSGSWPDLASLCETSNRNTKSMETIESDSDNNIIGRRRPNITVVTFPDISIDHSNNNWKNDNDSEDSERVGSDITESSCESLNPNFKPVAKPRKIYHHNQQEEVIYANCLELARESKGEEGPKERPVAATRQLPKDCDKKEDGDSTDGSGKKEETRRNRRPPVDVKDVPLGWATHVDTETQLPCYVHSASGQKWYSSTDAEGRVYFFEEHSAESSWTLPELPTPLSLGSKQQISEELTAVFNKISSSSIDHNRKLRNVKAFSMIVPDKREEDVNVNKNWSELSDGKMYVVLQGPLHYTKISEAGKKVRKSWSPVYVVLTETCISIYKDIKAFHSPKTSAELTIELNGAQVGSGENVSGRKHVLVVATQSGLQVALQCDNVNSALHWATNIQHIIQHLPKAVEAPGMKFSGPLGDCPEEPRKGTTGIGRSKSVNFKNKDDSMEDLGATPAERQMKIKARLKKFFHKRPTMESLVKKGIWKDEPVFNCYLEQACGSNVPRIPLFVQKCIACIESSPENMKTDGLYRASGNLSQIQKIRFQIDQHNYVVLEQEEDVHVLTGALKLFFRELKEPLVPYKLFPKAIKASMTANKKEKLSLFHEIVKALPTPNRDTLKFLLQHLLRVTQYQESNRMHVNNVAIVFGPTLMWPEQESSNMALDMMQQNMVIEALLNEYTLIFK